MQDSGGHRLGMQDSGGTQGWHAGQRWDNGLPCRTAMGHGDVMQDSHGTWGCHAGQPWDTMGRPVAW